MLVAAFLRLAWPGIAEFKFDEATVVRSALLFTREVDIPSGFPSSIAGVAQPPFMAFLLSPPFAISRNPAVGVFYLGLLSTVTVYLSYVLAKLLFDLRIGILSASFFALAPWVVFYTRKLWAQNVPLLTVIMMLSLVAVIRSQRRRWIIVTMLALGALIGLYLGNIVLVAVVGVILLIHAPNLIGERFRELVLWAVAGLAIATVFLLPYLINSIPTILATVTGVSGVEGGGFLFFRRLTELARSATGYQFHALVGEQFPEFYDFLPVGDLSIFDLAATWLIRLGMAYVLVRSLVESIMMRQLSTSYVILAVWLTVPLVAWSLSGLDPQPHRYIMVYPAQHIAMAVLIIDLIDWLSTQRQSLRPVLYTGVALWVTVLGAWQVMAYVGMMRFIDEGNARSGGFDVPARVVWETAVQARDLAEDQALPIIVYSDGDDPLTEGDAAVWTSVLGDQALHLVDGDSLTVMPASGDYVELTKNNDRTFTVEQRTAERVDAETEIVRFVNGIDLLEVEVPAGRIQPGENLDLSLTWQVWGIPPTTENYSFTVQLFTDDGIRWGQYDRQFMRTEYWQPSDIIMTEVPLTVSADAPLLDGQTDSGRFYQLVIAMYVFQPGELGPGVDVRDQDGNIIGTFLIRPYTSFQDAN